MLFLLRLFSRLPLPLIHALGAALGLAGLLRRRHRDVLRDNLVRTGLHSARNLLRIAMEMGKGAAELPRIWLAPLPRVFALVREVRGWEHLEAARATGRGTVLLTPHLGCWEVCGMYIANRIPCTALYTPPRQAWVHAMMREGRERSGVKTVPPGTGGVRALFNQLRGGESVFILPDQTANRGEGLWLRFLDVPAYMPALPYRLLDRTGAVPLLVFARRLSWGRGFRLYIEPLPVTPAATVESLGRSASQAMSALIRRHPEQYLWSYRLWRRRADIPPPPEGLSQGNAGPPQASLTPVGDGIRSANSRGLS